MQHTILLQKEIDYNFKNKELLVRSLTHPSMHNNNFDVNDNYEKLEFLGDAVLSMIISEMLIKFWPKDDEGDLAKRRAFLVCGDTLYKIALQIKLDYHLILSEGEEQCGGRSNPHNLENALEALIGAIYLDSDINSAKDFIHKLWDPLFTNMKTVPINPKTALQEWSQANGLGIPEYVVIKTQGPAHKPIFDIKVQITPEIYAQAQGHSKKEAEIQAASIILKQLK